MDEKNLSFWYFYLGEILCKQMGCKQSSEKKSKMDSGVPHIAFAGPPGLVKINFNLR